MVRALFISSAKWWRFITISLIPNEARLFIVRLIMGMPAIGSRGFGVVSVRGNSLLPNPADNIMAFVCKLPLDVFTLCGCYLGNCLNIYTTIVADERAMCKGVVVCIRQVSGVTRFLGYVRSSRFRRPLEVPAVPWGLPLCDPSKYDNYVIILP